MAVYQFKSSSSYSGILNHIIEERQDVIFRRVRGILNKITPETFDKLSKELVNVGLDSPRTLRGVIYLLFDKALKDLKYSSLYAKLCQELSEKAPNFEQEPGPNTFCKFLISKCEDEFERRRKATEDFDSKNELTDEEYEQKAIVKQKMLGNIKFICELGKKRLLQEEILHECIRGLLSKKRERPIQDQAQDLECLCQIMRTIGSLLDIKASKNLMNQYFERIDMFSRKPELPSRIRFMLRDVIDLRNNNWRPRPFQREDNVPLPLSKLREEAGYDPNTNLTIDKFGNSRNLGIGDISKIHGNKLAMLLDDEPSFTTSTDIHWGPSFLPNDNPFDAFSSNTKETKPKLGQSSAVFSSSTNSAFTSVNAAAPNLKASTDNKTTTSSAPTTNFHNPHPFQYKDPFSRQEIDGRRGFDNRQPIWTPASNPTAKPVGEIKRFQDGPAFEKAPFHESSIVNKRTVGDISSSSSSSTSIITRNKIATVNPPRIQNRELDQPFSHNNFENNEGPPRRFIEPRQPPITPRFGNNNSPNLRPPIRRYQFPDQNPPHLMNQQQYNRFEFRNHGIGGDENRDRRFNRNQEYHDNNYRPARFPNMNQRQIRNDRPPHREHHYFDRPNHQDSDFNLANKSTAKPVGEIKRFQDGPGFEKVPFHDSNTANARIIGGDNSSSNLARNKIATVLPPRIHNREQDQPFNHNNFENNDSLPRRFNEPRQPPITPRFGNNNSPILRPPIRRHQLPDQNPPHPTNQQQNHRFDPITHGTESRNQGIGNEENRDRRFNRNQDYHDYEYRPARFSNNTQRTNRIERPINKENHTFDKPVQPDPEQNHSVTRDPLPIIQTPVLPKPPTKISDKNFSLRPSHNLVGRISGIQQANKTAITKGDNLSGDTNLTKDAQEQHDTIKNNNKPTNSSSHTSSGPNNDKENEMKSANPTRSQASEFHVSKFMSILAEFNNNSAPNVSRIATKIKELKIPKNYQHECLISAMKQSMMKSENDRDNLGKILVQIIPSIFDTSSLSSAFQSIFEQMKGLEVETPKVKSLVAGLLSHTILDNLLSLEEVGSVLSGGKHHPLFLLVLQRLEKSAGQTWLNEKFIASKINLMDMLPEVDRSKDRLASILKDRSLGFLDPMLTIEPDLWEQLKERDSSSAAVYRWIKENVDQSIQETPTFAHVLISCLLKFIHRQALEKSKTVNADQKEEGAGSSDSSNTTESNKSSPTASSQSTSDSEKELLTKYQQVLQAILKDKRMQLATLYALQSFYYELDFPKGSLLRWFHMLYDMNIVDDDVFFTWKEEINDEFPGKGQALFQVNNWFNWLAEAESEEEEDV